MLTGHEAESYAVDRMERLIRDLAGCLTKTTLEAVIREIDENANSPIADDLLHMASRLRLQADTL